MEGTGLKPEGLEAAAWLALAMAGDLQNAGLLIVAGTFTCNAHMFMVGAATLMPIALTTITGLRFTDMRRRFTIARCFMAGLMIRGPCRLPIVGDGAAIHGMAIMVITSRLIQPMPVHPSG